MRVDESVTVRARPSRVWDLVGDPAHYRAWMDAVTHFDPQQPGAAQRGARYSMRMRVGAAEVGGLVELVEYERCRDIAWHSISGIDQRGRLRLREHEPGLTTVTLRITYQSPGGVWGLIADRVSGRQVRENARRSLAALRERLQRDLPADDATRSAMTLARSQATALRVFARAGVLTPTRPDRLLAALLALRRWGLSVPGAFAASAARYPDEVSIVDDRETITFAELDRRSSAIALGLQRHGVREADRVALLCRNHAGFVAALLALTKLGADVLLLNTGMAPPQLRDVLQRERADAIVHDQEFTSAVGRGIPAQRRFVAWSDSARAAPRSLAQLARSQGAEPQTPERPSRITILTSGTTGTPKGASRSQPRSADPIVGVLSRMPLRARETTLIAAPLFHAWGLSHLALACVLSSTIVLRRRVEPEQLLADVDAHRASAVVAIPVMLQRIIDLPRRARAAHDTSSLRVVAVSGSALPAELATSFMDAFGDVLYNLYGSTEVAAASIADPTDLRAAPGTAGRPPLGTVIKLLDDSGRQVPRGKSGRIFVGNDMLFEGYTGGGELPTVEGLMATGDVGHIDAEGRLFIEGRSDDMVVSGGENVYPEEVEQLLLAHPDIGDAAVVGVPDEEWGARLRAFVVVRSGRPLSVDDVKQHVRAQLARYKVPRDVVFVSSIPRSPTGKVAKADLERLA